jgi:hypothetical protein
MTKRDNARLRADQPFQPHAAFHFQRTTVFAHVNASETAPFSRNPPQNR